jgi:thioredoxin-like negative regulator of GroEL
MKLKHCGTTMSRLAKQICELTTANIQQQLHKNHHVTVVFPSYLDLSTPVHQLQT